MESIEEKKINTYTPAMKRAIYNYRLKHKEQHRIYNNKKVLEYYNNDKDKFKEKFKEYYKKKEIEKEEETGIKRNPKAGRPKKNVDNEIVIEKRKIGRPKKIILNEIL